MQELDAQWREYFDELDPAARLQILNALSSTDPNSPDEAVWQLCRTLYARRYTDPKHPDRTADQWLMKFIYLSGLYRRHTFRRTLQKEMHKALQELCLADAPQDEQSRTVLYWEYRNAARRYLSTCQGGSYASQFLGLKKVEAQEQLDAACEDIWLASRGLSRLTGLEEPFRLWNDALCDELIASVPACEERLAALDAGRLK